MKIEQISTNLKNTYIYLRLNSLNKKDPELITGYSFFRDTKLFELIPNYDRTARDKTVFIKDLEVHNRGRGYGTKLLKYLSDIARKEGFLYIVGWLSIATGTTFEGLISFYKKNGFEVYRNKEMGTIELGIIIKRL